MTQTQTKTGSVSPFRRKRDERDKAMAKELRAIIAQSGGSEELYLMDVYGRLMKKYGFYSLSGFYAAKRRGEALLAAEEGGEP